ncbi:nuclease domain-containing protein [Klebsiella aerogenes]|uniref:nuclease domain-containing protein n=1 Tax=Klebsiella aerogenes TaxID=548 RepID=UPI0028A4BEBB|nr:nuclease domain-containing protein [Klebsiella aerogenes]MDT4321247.1 DUF1364 family protein [Klebsiella aerogenes]
MADLRKAARGRECTVRIPGLLQWTKTQKPVCWRITDNGSGCGTACKPDDTQAAIACNCCHDLIDGRKKTTDYTYDELRLMQSEGVMRTLAIWKKEGMVKA